MKVTHLSTYESVGGAAVAAYRLHSGLKSLGHESRIITLWKDADDSDPTVVRLEPPRDMLTRLRRRLERRSLDRAAAEISARPSGLGFFSSDQTQHGADVLRHLPATDVLNLHWIAGLIDYRAFFRQLPKGLPVVWTLHDMNPITGGCHHAGNCLGFHARCGMCPELESKAENDISRGIWTRKNRAYSSLRESAFKFVTPSRWLADKVRESSLGGRFKVQVIPYGLDTEIFRPTDRITARRTLGLEADATYILFAAYYSSDSYKGFPVLLKSLPELQGIRGLTGLAVGTGKAHNPERPAIPMRALGFVKDERQMSLVYSAADLFILPSFQDNFPNTALEALACGTPVIGSHVGGIPEIVRDGQTGFTVPPGDSHALAKMIRQVLEDNSLRSALSAECRRVAVEEYSLPVQARRYEELYRELAPAVRP